MGTDNKSASMLQLEEIKTRITQDWRVLGYMLQYKKFLY